jgi:hypothetical protein
MRYNKNTLFFVNDYYIYINTTKLNYKYSFLEVDNDLYLYIKNKDININEYISINIIKDNKKYSLTENIKNNIEKLFSLNDIKTLPYNELNDNDHIDNIDIFQNFCDKYYIENNNTINNNYILIKDYIKYHWYLYGRYEPQLYFKYLLKKYENIIYNIPYSKIQLSPDKNKTLLFIDNRYDSSFIYLLILFLYSVDLSWNITVFTTDSNKKYYLNDFKKLNISGNIFTLHKNISNINDYSNLLKDTFFWKNIKEDNCLLFQYDSFCMGKFDDSFLNYNYIGAIWDHNPSLFSEINFGNGGTSFRKTRLMEYLCKKYENKDIKKNYPEDVFFAELLYEEKLNNCNMDIANKFSFENIYNENSVYGHQIYKSIDYNSLDEFIYNKLSKMAIKE